ncbi:Ankyrin repeat family protein [Fagus crenata]
MADQQDRSLSSEIDEFTYKPGIDSKSDVRNALLVVATLIAAVTFQAGLNPPGGVWQDNSPTPTQGSRITQSHEAGKAILGSRKVEFNVFVLSNTAAFSASCTIIEFLVTGFPFQLWVQIAFIFLGSTYAASITAVQPEGVVSSYGFYTALFLPFILAMARHIWRKTKA